MIDGPTVGDALDRAIDRYGRAFAEVLPSCRVWVNGEPPLRGRATELGPDDELAVLPPVSGGCGPWPT